MQDLAAAARISAAAALIVSIWAAAAAHQARDHAQSASRMAQKAYDRSFGLIVAPTKKSGPEGPP